MTEHALVHHLVRRRLAAGLMVVGLIAGTGLLQTAPARAAGAPLLTISKAPTSAGVLVETTSSGCSVSIVTDDPEVVLGADTTDACLSGSGLLQIAAGARDVVLAAPVTRFNSGSGTLSITAGGAFTAGVELGGVKTVSIDAGGAVNIPSYQGVRRVYSINSGGSVSLTVAGPSTISSLTAHGPVSVGGGEVLLGRGGIQAVGWPVRIGEVSNLPGSAGIAGSVVTMSGTSTTRLSADELRCGSPSISVALVRSVRLGPCSSIDLTIGSSSSDTSAPPDLTQVDGAQVAPLRLALGRLGVVDLPDISIAINIRSNPPGIGGAPEGPVSLGGAITGASGLSVGDTLDIRSTNTMFFDKPVTAKGALTMSAYSLVFDDGSAVSSTGNGRVSLLAPRRSAVRLSPNLILPGGVVPPGPLYANTSSERWGATKPDPTINSPYTLYYADSGSAKVNLTSSQHDVTGTQLRVAVSPDLPVWAGSAATPTGSVSFTREDGTALPGCDGLQLDSTGVATCTTRGLAETVAVRTVTARYSPDGATAYATATGTGTFTVDVGPAARVAVVGEPSTSAGVGTDFAAPLTASVVDAYNNPLAGVTVTWSLPSPGPTFAGGETVASAVSGTDGRATSPLLAAGTRAGQYVATASVPGVEAPATWTLKVVPGPATQIAATGGGDQNAAAGQPYASPLVATVRDSYGNTVVGAQVTFTSTGGGATFADGTATATVPTGDDGRASSPALSAGSIAGGVTVTGSTGGVADTVSWRLTTVAGAAATVSSTAGGTQSATPGQGFAAPLVAFVADDRGNPVAGAAVTFTIPSASTTTGAASFGGGRSSALVLTGVDGRATSPSIAAGSSAGPVTVVGTVPGVTERATWLLSVSAAGPARADLSLSLTAPVSVTRGGIATVSVKVTNNGTSTATKVGTALTVPRGWTVTDTGGGTLVGRGLVLYTAASLDNRATSTYTMRLTAPRTTTVAGVIGLALSGTPDPKLSNNASLGLVTAR